MLRLPEQPHDPYPNPLRIAAKMPKLAKKTVLINVRDIWHNDHANLDQIWLFGNLLLK
jgi:hypothetical protein